MCTACKDAGRCGGGGVGGRTEEAQGRARSSVEGGQSGWRQNCHWRLINSEGVVNLLILALR